MPKVLFTPSFEKDFRSLDPETRNKVRELCNNFSQTFFPSKHIRKLKGYQNLFRIRIGGYRLVYHALFKENKVVLLRILPRKEVYKRL